MLCKIALGWFFLWRKSGTVVAVGVPDVLFALWVDWLIDFFEERKKTMCQLAGGLQKVWQRKTNEGWMCGSRNKDRASPASTGSATCFDRLSAHWACWAGEKGAGIYFRLVKEAVVGAARNWISGVAWPLDFNYFVGLYRITNSDNKKGGIDKIPPTNAKFCSFIGHICRDGVIWQIFFLSIHHSS